MGHVCGLAKHGRERIVHQQLDIGLLKRNIKQTDFVYQPKRTSLVSGASQIDFKPKRVEGAGSILLLVDFAIDIDDFLLAIISEGEMMPRIIVDCLIAEEPTGCQPAATYLDFAFKYPNLKDGDCQKRQAHRSAASRFIGGTNAPSSTNALSRRGCECIVGFPNSRGVLNTVIHPRIRAHYGGIGMRLV